MQDTNESPRVEKERKRKKLLFLLIPLVLIVAILLFVSAGSSKPADTNTGMKTAYVLEMSLENFPREVTSKCSKFPIQLKVKNTGSVNIRYNQFQADDLGFIISDGNGKEFLSTVNMLGGQNLFVEDFNEIKPGEEKTLSLYSKVKNTASNKYPGSASNGFDKIPENGEQNLTLAFQKIYPDDIGTIKISKVEFSVKINIYRGSYSDTMLRECNNQ
jgi:hypothetical protein